ncbi:hypothetical protein [Actinospongicola halichondriae]|uniref:hypothetical protein n=1 Tax=Actinospongicola halichondriae TaxID=3236844 RepID=UPI003D567A7A
MGETVTAHRTESNDSQRRVPAKALAMVAGSLVLVVFWMVAVFPSALDGVIFPDDRFPAVGSSLEFEPISVGDSVTVGTSLFPDTTTTLDEVRPVLGEGSAEVSVRIVACSGEEAMAIDGGGSALGSSLDRCDDIAPVSGTTITASGERPGILAVITPLESGRVVIEGFEVTHSRGPFDRTETSGVRVELPVR